jgi:hypothetical protein
LFPWDWNKGSCTIISVKLICWIFYFI